MSVTAFAFLCAAVVLGAGLVADNPALTISGFCVVLTAFALLLHRDSKINAVAVRPQPAHWDTLNDLYAWPTAAHGSYPPEED